MPSNFQKTDETLQNLRIKFAYLEDILIVTKANLQEHESELDKILHQLNGKKLAMNLKSEFAKGLIKRLVFKSLLMKSPLQKNPRRQ